jgi:hypothetical protein
MARHLGFKVIEMPVTHRPRIAGETKYGFGIVQRALPGLRDLFAVRWMRERRRPVANAEIVARTGPSIRDSGEQAELREPRTTTAAASR